MSFDQQFSQVKTFGNKAAFLRAIPGKGARRPGRESQEQQRDVDGQDRV